MTASAVTWWPEPAAGDIVWCHFPDNIGSPKPKPRPALILDVYDDDAPEFHVRVAHGTSQRVTNLYAGEFAIMQFNKAAYLQAGLSYDTKFCLQQPLDLPFNSEWFSIPPAAPHGAIPKLGTLHPSFVSIAGRAYQAAHGAE